MYLRLEGKVALVTGGSRGSGRSIAAAFTKAEANAMTASRNAKATNTIEKNCKWVAPNVGHGDQVEALAAVKPEPTK